ncbi:Hypothetical predicted protein [Cloeon dipterum]|uniref:Decaprenyl-diphosphate synthase subunit 2 n=1 Tax=Cloeon dipterum TaxID=197152 RepID=A0A8S1DM07_9INSE|nr:Hypothetical predicted protein [Cloeon dipterum]
MSLGTKPIYCVSRAGRFLLNKTNFVQRNAPTVSVLVQGQSFFSTTSIRSNKQAINPRPDWNRAVSEAEKIVGYPTSFLSLRWLLSDEIANIALHLRKLVGSNHPLLKTAKNLLNNGRSSMQAWGLIVLLVSKAAGHKLVDDIEIDKAAGVLHSQRALAEVTEMIRTSNLVHKGLVNIYPGMYPDTDARTMQDMTFGNKIALLSGDYLLGNSCAELANLRNSELVELMSSAVRDMAEGEFVGERDKQNNPLPSPGLTEQDWTLRSVLSAGSLLGKSCQGTLKLAGHGEELQLRGYRFGQHLALAWQACLELEPFTSSAGADGQMPFSLTSAPVIFTLQDDPSLFEEINKGKENIEDVDYSKIHAAVMSGPGIPQTKELQRHHAQKALQELEGFEENDARKALSNIIFAMGEI